MFSLKHKARRQGQTTLTIAAKIEIIKIEIKKLRYKISLVKKKIKRQEKIKSINEEHNEE